VVREKGERRGGSSENLEVSNEDREREMVGGKTLSKRNPAKFLLTSQRKLPKAHSRSAEEAGIRERVGGTCVDPEQGPP